MKINYCVVNWAFEDEQLLEPYEWQEDDPIECLLNVELFYVASELLNDCKEALINFKALNKGYYLLSDGKNCLAIAINSDSQLWMRSNVTYELNRKIREVVQILPLTQFEYDIFGGGSIGYEPGGALYSDGTQFTLKYENIKEEWAGEYNEIVNNNVINYYAGTVRTTDTGIVPKATIVTLDNENGEGILGQMDDGSLDNIIQINKTVTGLPGNYSEPKPINGGVSEQDHTPKLVIEVELDGQIMFYPIPIVAPQPNTIYHIEKITLKGAPSPYCNCYPVLYDISTGAIVSTMTETTVSDIIVGADPETGELI